MMEPVKGITKGGTGYSLYADLLYVPDAEPLQDLDVYIPDGPAPKSGWPGVIYVHGGGFTAGDKADKGRGFEHALMALDNGFAMISANYRLPGRAPEQIEVELSDVQAALRYIVTNAGQWGLDSKKIAYLGVSAGGALVCAAAARASKEGEPPVFAVISVASATDFTKAGDYVDQSTPPFYIIHGTADSIVKISQAESFAASLDAAGVSYVFDSVEGGEHTRPVDHPNTMTLLEEQGRLNDAYTWLKGLLA